jgi:hypothetical protein
VLVFYINWLGQFKGFGSMIEGWFTKI